HLHVVLGGDAVVFQVQDLFETFIGRGRGSQFGSRYDIAHGKIGHLLEVLGGIVGQGVARGLAIVRGQRIDIVGWPAHYGPTGSVPTGAATQQSDTHEKNWILEGFHESVFGSVLSLCMIPRSRPLSSARPLSLPIRE